MYVNKPARGVVIGGTYIPDFAERFFDGIRAMALEPIGDIADVSLSDNTQTSLWVRSFESGDLSNWSGETGDYSVVTSPTPEDGTYACRGEHPSSTAGFFIDSSVPDDTPSKIVAYLRTDSKNSNVHDVRFQDSGGTTGFGFEIGDFNGGIFWGGFRTSTTKLADYTVDTWYKLEARNIDFAANTADVYLDGTLELSGASFSASGISSVANIEMEHNTSSGSPFNSFIDGIKAF